MSLLQMLFPLAVSLGLAACTPQSKPGGGLATATVTTASAAQRAPADARIATVCAKSPCNGAMARVTPYMRGDKPAIYRYDGDLSTCSHPPSIYYDVAGNSVLSQGNHPVEKAEAELLQEQRATLLMGLTESKSVPCGAP
jgi:hypothetical protein